MTRDHSETELALADSLGQLPRVTEILSAAGLGPDYSTVSHDQLEHARLRGMALHLAIQYHHQGVLDDTSLHPEVAPGFSAYLKFLADTGHEPIASEIELIHPAWRYIGHPDRIGFLGPDRVLIDFKYVGSVDLPATSLQLAGYRLAWEATRPKEPLGQSLVLQLKLDGTYRLHEVPKSRWAADTQIFLAALVVFQARARARREQ